jgi:hypothetical protein
VSPASERLPRGGATLVAVQPGQFPIPDLFHTTNPIPAVWLGVWTPESFQPREVQFRTAGSVIAGSGPFSGVILRLNGTLFGSVACGSGLGSTTMIPVVPSPGAALVLAGGLAARRRDRRTTQRGRA